MPVSRSPKPCIFPRIHLLVGKASCSARAGKEEEPLEQQAASPGLDCPWRLQGRGAKTGRYLWSAATSQNECLLTTPGSPNS